MTRGKGSFFQILFAMLLMAGGAISGHAQEAREHWYTFNIGGGYSPLVGQISDRLDNGWLPPGGLCFRMTSHFELAGQFAYHGFGVKPVVLAEAAVPSADSHVWSI